jgi:hypothetical protein
MTDGKWFIGDGIGPGISDTGMNKQEQRQRQRQMQGQRQMQMQIQGSFASLRMTTLKRTTATATTDSLGDDKQERQM